MPVSQDDLGYVRAIARRIQRGGHLYDMDEMESDGMLALLIAIEKWDETESMRFAYSHDRRKYLGMCVRRRIIDGLRRRNGTSQEGQGHSRGKFDSAVATERFDAPLRQEATSLHEIVASPDKEPEDENIEGIDCLRERERETIQRTIVGGETLAEVARSWGVSEQRVSQIRIRGMDRLSRERGLAVPLIENRHLAKREMEILQRISDGETNQQIASAYAVSIETVKTQVIRVLAKTGARNRAHAVAIAFRQGVLR